MSCTQEILSSTKPTLHLSETKSTAQNNTAALTKRDLSPSVFTHNFYLLSRNKHPTRKQTLSTIINFYDESHKCHDSCLAICDDLFSYPFDQTDCKQLPYALVQKFQSIYQAGNQNNLQAFQGFDTFDLKFFLSFSLEPMVRVLQNWTHLVAKDFLKRLAWDWSMAQVVVQEDLDFILLHTLLNRIYNDPIRALGVHMEQERSFQEIAVIKQNDFALSWLHGFLKTFCKGKDDRCMLDQYCILTQNYSKGIKQELSQMIDIKNLLLSQKEVQQNEESVSLDRVCAFRD